MHKYSPRQGSHGWRLTVHGVLFVQIDGYLQDGSAVVSTKSMLAPAVVPNEDLFDNDAAARANIAIASGTESLNYFTMSQIYQRHLTGTLSTALQPKGKQRDRRANRADRGNAD